MKRLLRQIFPERFFQHEVYWSALGLAMVITLLLIAQLYTFEDFPEVIESFGLPGGSVTVVLLVALIPLVELLSLPYFPLTCGFWAIAYSALLILAAALVMRDKRFAPNHA